MWVVLNDSFLSIVAHRGRPKFLLVRARRSEDITVVFPGARVIEGKGSDYEFRAVLKRRVVEDAMVGEVRRIDYDNFKNSVREPSRHDVYLGVWSHMMRLSRTWRRPAMVVPIDDRAEFDAAWDAVDFPPNK
jgi:hypothetical protein